jgi:hypothetical protein
VIGSENKFHADYTHGEENRKCNLILSKLYLPVLIQRKCIDTTPQSWPLKPTQTCLNIG